MGLPHRACGIEIVATGEYPKGPSMSFVYGKRKWLFQDGIKKSYLTQEKCLVHLACETEKKGFSESSVPTVQLLMERSNCIIYLVI